MATEDQTVTVNNVDSIADSLARAGIEDSEKRSNDDNGMAENKETRALEVLTFEQSKVKDKGAIDPSEMVNKTIENIYHISEKEDPDLDYESGYGRPSSYGIAFEDGTIYHIRLNSCMINDDAEFDGDEDELIGKTITAASFIQKETLDYDITQWSSYKRLGKHVTFGIQVEGEDKWHLFWGEGEDYDSDSSAGICLVRSEVVDVYVVKVKGAGKKKRRN